jgi:hypothetical protein
MVPRMPSTVLIMFRLYCFMINTAIRRCDGTTKMLGFIEEMFKKYQVTIRCPIDYNHF